MTETDGAAPASRPAVPRRRGKRARAQDQPSTIRDVAAEAGVSVATVSRTLAGNYPVSAATRDRVMAAVESLRYVVNLHARALSGQVPGPIALVLPDLTGLSLAQVAAGVEHEAASRGRLSLVCATHGDVARENDLVQLMCQQHAAAVVLVGGAVPSREYERRMAGYARALDAVGSRLVLCGRSPLRQDLPVTVVEYDNAGGAFQATDHLLSAGHRRILFLGGKPDLDTAVRRRDGHLRALRAYGLRGPAELDIPGEYTRASGYARARQALRSGVRFTAVVAGADVVATGARAALQEAGVDVPGEVSLVGFDDVPFAADLAPALTTVRVPYEDLGRTAVRLALDRGEAPGDDHVVLGTQLVVRQSVRPAAQAG